jgi:hypothetical protein
VQGIGSTLTGGTWQVVQTEPVAFGQVGLQLAFAEALVDLVHEGALDIAHLGIQVRGVVEGVNGRVAIVVDEIAVAVGAIGIGESFPALSRRVERVDIECGGLVEEEGHELG